MSFAFWAKAYTSSWNTFFDIGSTWGIDNIYFAFNQTHLAFANFDNIDYTTFKSTISTTSLSPGTWNHYVVSLDESGNFAVYLNGNSTFVGKTMTPRTLVHDNTFIGRSISNGFLNGAIKDFQFALGTVFTPLEAAYLYANVCPRGSYSSLQHTYTHNFIIN